MRFRDEAERTKARVEIENAFPDLAVARRRTRGGELRLVAALKPEAQKRIQDGAVAAEHHDPAQPRERARRRRADHPAAGRRPGRRAASRRAGHGAREGHPRPHRDARDPHGQRRSGRARSGDRRQRAVRQRPVHRARRRAGAGAAAGRADRRPHQRRAARLRPAHQRARRAHQPRRHRARASSRK